MNPRYAEILQVQFLVLIKDSRMMVTQSFEIRDDLVIEYQNYARAICFKIVQQFKIPTEFVGDLIAAANLGLVEAASKFDPNYGVDFKSYSFFRIRGEAIDFLRKNTNLSPVQYKHLKTLEALDSLAQSSFHRQSALSDNVAPQQDERMAKLLNLLVDGVLIYQLQRTTNPTERFLKDYSEQIAVAETTDKIATLLDVLNEREYKVIYDYYFLDKTFMEISEELDHISKSWMSRLHHQALRKMREAYLKK